MGRVEEEVVIVTGAARGIGAATACKLVEQGARVVIADIIDDEGRELSKQLGQHSIYEHADVTQSSDWSLLVKNCEQIFGPPTVLVNNAGVTHYEAFETMSEKDYRRVIEINQLGVFLGMQSVLDPMRRSGRGSIINISSVAAITAFPNVIGYVASKWAVRGMSKAAALELGQFGIRVNSIHPGVIETEMSTAEEGVVHVEGQALARLGTPEEVANMALYLASPESRYSTGSEFIVDGGYTAR